MKKTSCLLLFFWVPLVNLGPSLHHADFLGFHSHCCGAKSCHNTPPVASSEGCSHHHHCHDDGVVSCHAKPAKTNGQQPRQESPNLLITGRDAACSLCKFFDEYHVVFDSVDNSVEFTYTYQHFACRVDVPLTAALPATARGPPATSLWG
ncbi:MAG: hypothetical protein MK108_15595 [Mariniblastus sp.]|nr:hypothetical protein [Mariniblastus sp.]